MARPKNFALALNKMDVDSDSSDSSWDQVQTEDTASSETVQQSKPKGWFSFLQRENSHPLYSVTLPPDDSVVPLEHELEKTVNIVNSDTIETTKTIEHVMNATIDEQIPALEAKCGEVEDLKDSSESKESGVLPQDAHDEPPPLEEIPQTPNLYRHIQECVASPDIYLPYKDDCEKPFSECIIQVENCDISPPEPSTMERLANTFVSDLWFWTTDILLSVSVISIMSCFTNIVWQGETA